MMQAIRSNSKSSAPLWADYRHNMARHVLGVSRYFQADIMRVLTENKEYASLRMSFEPFISLLGQDGMRLTELARALGISKQACNQATNQIEAAGYIERIPDLSDRRAKLVRLNATGLRLRADGIDASRALERHCVGMIGEDDLETLRSLMARLVGILKLPGTQRRETSNIFTGDDILMAALLPRLSDYISQDLMQRTRAKGHPGLKLSHGQVLTLIGSNGARVHQLARAQSVSKQAISAIALDLVELGYVLKQADPDDQRASLLLLTDRGEQLLQDSVHSVQELANYFSELLGDEHFARLDGLFKRLYAALHLEEEIFGPDTALSRGDTDQLAQELLEQLGEQRAQALVDKLQSLLQD
jgi:DNA-binding MarR family transcriptional regulator